MVKELGIFKVPPETLATASRPLRRAKSYLVSFATHAPSPKSVRRPEHEVS